MKYVRMEDGIFNTYDMFVNMLKEFKEKDWDFTTIKIEQRYGKNTLSCSCKCFNSSTPYEITVQFIKQADTIEELCDYFAFDDTLQNSIWDLGVRLDALLFTSRTWAMIQAQRQDRVIIGYIVIERKGVNTLEPVAKGKGAFELL